MTIEGHQLGYGCYRLLNLIARSSTSEIYLAEDTQNSRQVVIKVFLPENSVYPNVDATKWGSRLLLREAEVITKFIHPHILALLGYGEEVVNGIMLVYLVMPFCPDGSLATWLKQRNSLLSPQDVAQFVRQAAAGLAYTHYNQILHLNVKPSNFLIQRNKGNAILPNLLLSNFRIVKFSAASLGESQIPYGTPIYMAPEQWNGYPVPATDQYALAVMTYQMLTGRPPFQGTPEHLKYQHLNMQPQPPSTLNPQFTKDIDEVILYALAKKHEDRFKSVSAFARAFDQAIQVSNPPNNPNVTSKQKGEDIHTTISISHAEALTGTNYILPVPEGRHVTVPIPANAYRGQTIILEGQGKPSPVGGPAGDAIITITVANTTPATATPDIKPQKTPVEKLKSKISKVARNNEIKADILLYCVLTGVMGCLAGIVLNAANILPPIVANIGSSIAALIALIAGSWAVIEKLIPKDVWRNAKKLPVVLFSLITVVILSVAALLTFSYLSSLANPYTHQGKLALDDPLIDNSKNLGWPEFTESDGSCKFTAAGYQASNQKLNNDNFCTAMAPNFNNFVYEVQMTLMQGDCGGLEFRANIANNDLYYFHICRDQGFDLKVATHTVGATFKSLANGVVPTIIHPPKQPNIVAVVVLNSNISVYVNHQLLASVVDANFSSGQIGVAAEDNGNPTVVVYRNAKVWTL